MFAVGTVDPKGSALLATGSIQAGTAILTEEPFEAVLDGNAAENLSHWSFKPSKYLQRCVGCKFARYADRKEQKLAWANGHREECKALQRQGELIPGQTIRLMSRILWKRARLKEGGFEPVHRLVTHWERLGDSQKVTFANAAHATRLYMDPEEKAEVLPSRREIAELFAGLACNSHTVCNDEEQPIGLGLYCTGALVNHSCQPSAVQVFLGRRICFRALCSLQPGEEITIAYVELGQTREERRAVLLERYHFDTNEGLTQEKQVLLGQKQLRQKPGMQEWPPIVCKVWQTAPFLLDKADHTLCAVLTVEGKEWPGSGISIQAPPACESSDGNASFPVDGEEQLLGSESSTACQSKEELSPSGRQQDMLHRSSGYAEHGRGPLLVDCWGSAFQKGRKVDWDYIHRLLQVGLSWYMVTQRANEASTQASFASLAAIDQALDPTAQYASNGIMEGYDANLGPLHVLRCRLLEVKFRVSQQTGRWEDAIEYGTQLRPFYELVYPKMFPLRALHEAAMAKIADLLQHPAVALTSARRALETFKIIRPEAACITDLLQIDRTLSRRP